MKRKLYISTLAFNSYTIDDIINILVKNKIKFIDLAPLTFFKNWKIFFKKIKYLKNKLKKNKIEINAIQGIFFQLKIKLFFGSKKDIQKLQNHLYKIILASKELGIKKIIIGSSFFREKKKLSKKLADTKFINFLSRFKNILKKNKIYFCIETIPKQYNEDYLYDFNHTLELVKKINCKYILINFDTSIYHFKKYNFRLFSKNFSKIHNTQVSSKNFKSFISISKNNKKFSKSLKDFKKLTSISLEMILNKPNELTIQRSISNFKKYFS